MFMFVCIRFLLFVRSSVPALFLSLHSSSDCHIILTLFFCLRILLLLHVQLTSWRRVRLV